MPTHLEKADELLAMEAELEVARQKHAKAFEAYKSTPVSDATWQDKLLELSKAAKELDRKIDESRERLAKSKGFHSYRDMIICQPLTPKAW